MGGNIAEVGRQAIQTPLAQKSSLLRNYLEGATRAPGGFTSGASFGLMNPLENQPAQTSGGKVGEFLGSMVGFQKSPVTLGILKVTNPPMAKLTTKLTPRLAPFAPKIAPRLAGATANVLQGFAFDAAQRKFPSKESIGLDVLTGLAAGPNQFDQVARSTKSNFSLDKRTFDELIEAEEMIRNPKMFLGRVTTGSRTDKQAIKKIREQGLEIVERLSAKYLPDKQLYSLKTPQARIKALADLNSQNRLANVPEAMNLLGGEQATGYNQSTKFSSLTDKKPRFESGTQASAAQPTKGDMSALEDMGMGIVGKSTPSNLKTTSKVTSTPKVKPMPQQSVKITQTPTRPSSPLGDILAQKERGFVTNVKESPTSTKPLKEGVKGTYTPITNQGTLSQAQQVIKQSGWDNAKAKIANEPFTAENNLVGQELMRQAQQSGRHDEAVEIAETLAKKGTEAGQSVQAFSVWSRMTPEGMLRYATNQVENAKKNAPLLNKIFGMKNVKLTPEDSKVITDLMKKANAAPTEAEQAAYVKQVFEYVGKKLPWGVSDILDEYRYNNMLSNPLTHLRNVYSNVMQTFITRPATLAAEGRPLEAIKYELGAIKALPEAFDNTWKTLRGNKPLGRLDSVIKEGPVKPSRLPVLNLPSKALEAGDQFFSTLIKGGEKARGATEEAAQSMAEYSLFRQDLKPNQQGVLLNKIDDVTKAVYQLRRVGLGWFIPFVRTPMNVAKQMIEYSPAGVLTTIGAGNKRSQAAKAFLGSMAMAYGAKIAMEDRTTWAAPTDPKAKELFYASGKKPFSVKVGNKWVPMQYFGVYQWAVGLPAAAKYYQEESPKALTDDQITKLTKTAASLAYMWSQQTFVSGLASFVNMAQGDVDYNFKRNLAFTGGQLIPLSGLQRYIATVMDPIYRKATSFSDQLKSGIPGMTQDLEPYTTPDGQPETRNITNYAAPFAMGIENPTYTQQYDDRQEKLQQNAVINKARKDIEMGSKSSVDAGTIKVVKVGDKIREIDMDRLATPPTYPETTGNDLLDKELVKDFKSTITAIKNDVTDLYKAGEITKEEAEKQLEALTSLYYSGSGGKKPKKITVRKTTLTPIKLKKSSTNLKIKKLPKPPKRTNGFRITTSTPSSVTKPIKTTPIKISLRKA